MAALGLAGALGTWLGGFLTQYLLRRTRLAPILVSALGATLAAPLLFIGITTTNISLMFAAFLIANVFQTFYLGPMFGVTQSVVSLRLRATSIGILLFIINLIGYGMGPPFIGYMADVFTNAQLATTVAAETLSAKCSFVDANLTQVMRETCQQAKAYGMKIACLITIIFYLLAAVVFLTAGRFLKSDLVHS